jgi:hypothetical protein
MDVQQTSKRENAVAVDLNSIVVQGREQVSAEVDGEVVMMSVAQGNYYGLAGIGGRIWELIAEPRRVSEVCQALVAEYRVDRATCEADALRFLNDMADHGLIECRGQ